MPTTKRTKIVRVPGTTNNITKGIINYINARKDCFAFRVNNAGVYDEAKKVYRKSDRSGIADIIACLWGEFVAIEVKNKTTRDRMSEAQKGFEAAVTDAGGWYFIVTDYEEFVKLFEEPRPLLYDKREEGYRS
jgi:hypothetical protein